MCCTTPSQWPASFAPTNQDVAIRNFHSPPGPCWPCAAPPAGTRCTSAGGPGSGRTRQAATALSPGRREGEGKGQNSCESGAAGYSCCVLYVCDAGTWVGACVTPCNSAEGPGSGRTRQAATALSPGKVRGNGKRTMIEGHAKTIAGTSRATLQDVVGLPHNPWPVAHSLPTSACITYSTVKHTCCVPLPPIITPSSVNLPSCPLPSSPGPLPCASRPPTLRLSLHLQH